MRLLVTKSFKVKQGDSVLDFKKDTVVDVTTRLFLALCKNKNYLSNFVLLDEQQYEFVIYSKVLNKQIIVGNDEQRSYKERDYYTFEEMKGIIDATKNLDEKRQVEHLKILDNAKAFGKIDKFSFPPVTSNAV